VIGLRVGRLGVEPTDIVFTTWIDNVFDGVKLGDGVLDIAKTESDANAVTKNRVTIIVVKKIDLWFMSKTERDRCCISFKVIASSVLMKRKSRRATSRGISEVSSYDSLIFLMHPV
jgi:hypothetical protein